MSGAAQVRSQPSANAKQMGIDFFGCAEWGRALLAFEQAITEGSSDAELHNYRARTFEALGRHSEALLAIDQALAIDPINAADLKNRRVLLRRLGRLSEALLSYEAALARQPRDLDLVLKRIHVLNELDRREESLSLVQRAQLEYPDSLDVLNVRGMVLENMGRYEEALADFDRMLGLSPNHVDAINNRGMVQARQGHWAGALASYDHSLSIQPDQAQAFYNRAIVRLALGDWIQGLREFECRWNLLPLKATQLKLSTPLWLGNETLAGRTILVYHEQGYGDTLQMARYVPQLAALGAKVVLAVPSALCRLMKTLAGNPSVISLGDPTPVHDCHAPMMSLILAFGTTPQTVPAEIPYLHPNPQAVQRWQTSFGPRNRPRIGLVWSGRRYAPINYPRDVALEMLRPLFELDADFISLQKEISEADEAVLSMLPCFDVESIEAAKDFADTATLIDTLDLVISTDTAVAHLAGAMGKRVWLLNRHASCWRWGQQGTATAWYPNMHIFRQPSAGKWQDVVDQVKAACQKFLTQQTRYHSVPLASLPPSDDARRQASWGAQLPAKREKIRFVCATRLSREEFFSKSPLGRSLQYYRTFPRHQRIELRLFQHNTEGLSALYNIAIKESRDDPAILVFIHDDVYLSDYYWANHLVVGLSRFDIVGLAGNRRRVSRQASWMYLDDQFLSDRFENLSGVLGHGEGFPDLTQLSIYGEPGREVKLLDGVMLAARSERLITKDLRFDPLFTFDFYDMDFCRQAELRGLRMGTWAISVIHASAGKLGSKAWHAAYRTYLSKYGEL